MKSIELSRLTAALTPFEGNTVYLHLEVNPGAVVRNVPVRAEALFAAGRRPYRVAIRTAESGWIRAEGLTDMEITPSGQLLLAGHDSSGRITAALQLSLKPFDFGAGEEGTL